MNRPHTHCPDCGAGLPDEPWPRTCTSCDTTHFLNPHPVAVLLVPTGDGVLTVRRDIEPKRGELALPGGFIGLQESWQQAATRELREETGIGVDPEAVETFDAISAPDGTVLIFGVAPPCSPQVLSSFESTDEVSELVVVEQPRALAFPIHTEVLTRWFDD